MKICERCSEGLVLRRVLTGAAFKGGRHEVWVHDTGSALCRDQIKILPNGDVVDIRQSKKALCPTCRKEITEEEFVVNWSSCADCFKKHIDAYYASRSHSPLTLSETKEVLYIHELTRDKDNKG
jgi:hypothetical protein